MESQNFWHEHPLLLLNEELINNGSKEADCSGCGEKVSAPSFSCEDCGFYLHKKCAEAPLEINHPFHRDHPLALLQSPPYSAVCDFCFKRCERFVYHCPCGLDFHIKCALFTNNIAKKNFNELAHVALEDPQISSRYVFGKYLGNCFGCGEPLANDTYFSPDCGFNLHKKCAEQPLQINHMCHCNHPLILQFIHRELSCKICQKSQRKGFVYCCSPCKFFVHIECVSPSSSPLSIIEDKSHPHPFTLFWRRSSFICDACGLEGNYVAYICCACNILVHKKCTSWPRVIRNMWHDHHVFLKYSLLKEDFRSLNCIICHDEVNTEHGSYYCADCKIIFHVNCATKDTSLYQIISLENEDEQPIDSLTVLPYIIEKCDVGEATKIKHFTHVHSLVLCDKITENDKCCDGCMLPISASLYYCLECDFFLHKTCAELPKRKHVWFHRCQQDLILTSDNIFLCEACGCLSNGFAYKCDECEEHICLRCVTLTPGAQTSEGHEHPLLFYDEYKGQCSACGADCSNAFRCKDCNFALDGRCIRFPIRAQHKCDEHFLALAYHDDNKYTDWHYCDICEERRDPNYWFYHCATCNTSTHVNCVLGEYPFIKLGSIYQEGNHPHPLTFVKKIHVYPECIECGKLCQDLALECAGFGCNYVVHYNCIAPSVLWGLQSIFSNTITFAGNRACDQVAVVDALPSSVSNKGSPIFSLL